MAPPARLLLVLLVSLAAGCATASRAVVLTPSTALGTVLVRLTADSATPAVVVDTGRGRPPANMAAAREALARAVAAARIPRSVADRMVRIAGERVEEGPQAAPPGAVGGLARFSLRDEPPERWIERIAEFRKEGRHDEADKLLAEFKQRFPDYKLPGNVVRP